MKYKWLGEWYDTVLYILFVSGLLISFMCYWGGEYRLRCAELAIHDFLDTVSAKGEIDRETYEDLTERIHNAKAEYDLNIETISYVLHPVYDYVSEEKIADYFMNRNIKKEKELQKWQQESESIEKEWLCFQTETNASILAAEQAVSLPLPENVVTEIIEAVRPVQEVYEDEELITLCKIVSEGKMYYAQAEPLQAKGSGILELRIALNEEEYYIPVRVLCHPRHVVCDNGHEVINTRELIEEKKVTGKINCPFCARIPESISKSRALIKKQTGKKLTAEDLFLTVTYMNGTAEVITPESEEWQDTFDETYCGMQTVYVSYRGMQESIIVLTENEMCKKCGNDCNERNREDYDTFPYCTECMSGMILFTGEVFEEKLCMKTDEIIVFLENGGLDLKKGDFIVVQLLDNGKTVSMLQKEILQGG